MVVLMLQRCTKIVRDLEGTTGKEQFKVSDDKAMPTCPIRRSYEYLIKPSCSTLVCLIETGFSAARGFWKNATKTHVRAARLPCRPRVPQRVGI